LKNGIVIRFFFFLFLYPSDNRIPDIMASLQAGAKSFFPSTWGGEGQKIYRIHFTHGRSRMGTMILRFFLILICSIGGFFIAGQVFGTQWALLWGAAGGIMVAILSILIEESVKRVSLRSLCGAVLGLIAGFIVAKLLADAFLSDILKETRISLVAYLVTYSIPAYIGIKIGVKKGEEFSFASLKGTSRFPVAAENPKILDTSVIIDGRVADICETGIIEGTFIIPQFILHELQHVADSADSIKRTRGKRGLEILHRIQKQVDVEVKVIEQDFPKIQEVDAKLVELAKKMGAKIVTNDSNLNKVAELQGVDVLNINKLANALKPVVLPGEDVSVKVIKEGKEPAQGVAYLDDGTMVVIENGLKYMGKNIDVTVTQILQTTAGRMIFAKVGGDTGGGYFYPVNDAMGQSARGKR
jgi:uncharacterized protein YacL